MKFDLNKVFHWLPRGLALFLIVFWLAVLFVYSFGPFLTAGVMAWFILLLVTALAWKQAFLGGFFYIILGILLLVFVLNSLSISSFLSALPFFVIGLLFIVDYLHQKNLKKK